MSAEKVIVALDVETPELAVEMAGDLSAVFPFFKIGMKLFTRSGPDLVREVLKHGKVFLDLKFYDIPTVVADACFQAAALGVSLITVHASGGAEMMRQSAEKVHASSKNCKLLAVTVLTSFSDLEEFGIVRPVQDQVEILGRLAVSSRVDGIVCSPPELVHIRDRFPSPFLIVTPGIRGPEDEKKDQKRTASAAEALRTGADFIVIGRPIVAAPDPIAAARKIAESINR